MTKRLNPNIAKALDMDIPEDAPVEDSAPLVTVEPHELVLVDNPDLPDMSDIETKTQEGEKQLEMLIERGMGMFTELYDELPEIEPKYRARHLEITALIMGNTLDAIKHKTEYQLKRRKGRMEESKFGKGGDTKIGTANFFGSREEIMALIDGDEEAPPITAKATPDDDAE